MYSPSITMPHSPYSGHCVRPSLPWRYPSSAYHESGSPRTPSPPYVTPTKIHHEPVHRYNRHYPLHDPNPYSPSLTPRDIQSRIAALNRRAVIVSAQLAHLTSVVKPLETHKPDTLSQTHLHDMHQEGVGLVNALGMFEKQAEEVLGMLAELLGEGGRRQEVRDWDWEGEWSGWERGRMRGKVRDL
jgi:hypothetical protein